LRSARWLRFPSLTLEALAVSRGNRNTVQNGITANLVLEQPLLTFGRIGGTIDKAEALYLARRAGVDETARDVALQVVDAFYSVAAAARRQQILEEGISQHEDLLRTIRNRVQQEISPQADYDLAMSRTAQLQQELELAKAQRTANLTRLVQLVGTSAIDLGDVPAYDPVTMHPAEQGAIEKAMLCDPAQERLRAEVLVAEAEAKVAKASIFPQLLGQVSRNEITGTRVGAVLRAQTTGGLSQLAATDAARTRVQAAEFNISTAERTLREQLNLDFVNNRSSRERVESGKQASLTSALVTESYKRQFITGRRTWLDVMNAVREATSSKLSMADAEISAMQSNAHIWLRTCGWQPRPLDSGTVELKK
jgi:adhesin transport system outer membrane protein